MNEYPQRINSILRSLEISPFDFCMRARLSLEPPQFSSSLPLSPPPPLPLHHLYAVAGTTISPGDKRAIDAKKRGQMVLEARAAVAVTAAGVAAAADSVEAVAAIEVAEGAVVAVTAAVAVAADPCAAVAAVVAAVEDRPLTDFSIRPLKKA